ncbi:serine O-acetyltransferase [Chryseobacterium soli]|uniref:serine O-acetyltransferase n=1 Tax=Chryseobacterium soli TaxID=445961 RepID=UPI002955DCF7|nr:serine acetyltransferase [Chryseobacterium soli]MDV7699589.1 serine O-acetyltransferase [Chryseobacterium soli]
MEFQDKQSDFLQYLFTKKQKESYLFHEKHLAENFVQELFDVLFIYHLESYQSSEQLEYKFNHLRYQLHTLINKVSTSDPIIKEQVEKFFDAIPYIYDMLLLDAEEILHFDPAAHSKEEIFISYPGFFATAVYRFAHQLYQQKIQILPRVISEYAHSKTGIDINPGAEIGKSFFIDHGTGIVIGETTIIGNHVKIYQGVTLGALSVSKDLASLKRHPTIQDHVVLYSGATILGGTTVIGEGSIIGGNVWITHSIATNSVVYHTNQIKIKDNNPFPEVIDFVI